MVSSSISFNNIKVFEVMTLSYVILLVETTGVVFVAACAFVALKSDSVNIQYLQFQF